MLTELNNLTQNYGAESLARDPLRFAHLYEDPLDRELVAFLSALVAFGNVRGIGRTISDLLGVLGSQPRGEIDRWRLSSPKISVQHRWIQSEDFAGLFSALAKVLHRFDSLENLFLHGGVGETPTWVERMDLFMDVLADQAGEGAGSSRGLRFLLARPRGGSTCKRFNLFLRWVVRRSWPDLGLWCRCGPSDLYLPIDTHVARITRYLGLTRRTTANWRMVEEVTGRLQSLDPTDPLRFDFALAHLGISRDCQHRFVEGVCSGCPLVGLCQLAQR